MIVTLNCYTLLAYYLPAFVWKIETFPYLVCVIRLKEIVSELTQVLESDCSHPQLLSYHATFQLGDFYVSPLVFRHLLFSPPTIMPVAFLIHERKLLSCHDTFMEWIRCEIPVLKRLGIPIVTDREQSLSKSIEKNLPNATVLHPQDPPQILLRILLLLILLGSERRQEGDQKEK
jgi:hypothetical protein